MAESSLLAAGLAFLMPAGYALIAVGGFREERARQSALAFLAALGLATLGYLAIGFALQYGGIGLVYNRPGYQELIWEWSVLGVTWGSGWGTTGLAGWGMQGAASTPGAYALALAALPWVATAAMIPLISLRGRVPAWASGIVGLLMGALIFPIAGNWIWGGGWLANLGRNIELGHGFVDPGGAGLVHLLGAAAAFAVTVVFLPRVERPTPGKPTPLPPVHLPLLAVLGCAFLLVGNLAWLIANPLLDTRVLGLEQIVLNSFVAMAGGALLPLLYTWFVAGYADPLMSARGMAAGSIAALAIAPFVAPGHAFVIGALAGLSVPLVSFVLARIVRLDDPTATLSVHGLGAVTGLVAVGLLADGRAGAGWNAVGAASYLGVAGQGVTGMMAATGYQPDWPSQMQAQLVGIVSVALLGFFLAWLAVAPAVAVRHVVREPGWPDAALAAAGRTAWMDRLKRAVTSFGSSQPGAGRMAWMDELKRFAASLVPSQREAGSSENEAAIAGADIQVEPVEPANAALGSATRDRRS